jgi:hypothetical protein
LDTCLTFTSAIVQALVVIVLVRRRISREFPFFSAYLVWVVVAGFASAFAVSRLQPNLYLRLYFISSVFDAMFMFAILVEMSMAVLKPVKAMLPRWTIALVMGLIGAVSMAVWQIASPPGLMKVSKISQYIIHFEITSSMLRILFFVALAALSQLLSLGWRDRVVQISTGLGFFSLVSLCVTFLHMNQGVGEGNLNDLYHVLDRMVVVSYIASLLYWTVCFAKDVPERQEFTPQMQSLIASVAQNAHRARLAMSNSEIKGGRGY